MEDIKDPEIKRIVRDMAEDEREIFLSIFLDLKAKAIASAKRLTPIRLAKQRKEQAKQARAKLIELDQEQARLSQEYSEWREVHGGEFVPVEIASKRDRVTKIIAREKPRLLSIIQMGEV